MILVQQSGLYFRLIQIWECALNWFTVTPVHEYMLDVCHLSLQFRSRVQYCLRDDKDCARFLPLDQGGEHILKHILNMLVDHYMYMIPN
jgi:hypothetical protein